MSQPQPHIHPDAKIGKNVIIEPFSSIYGDVEIGEGTWIGPNVTIMDGARIGKNCKIFPGAVISAIPQDLKYNGEKTTTEIGNNTVIRECVTINKGTTDKMMTAVGNNCLVMAYVHVAHDCIVGNHCILANNVTLAGHIEVEDHVIMEGLVAVQQFVKIGAHAFVCGASLVRKNIPPFVKVAREPLSYVGINSIGLRRRGYDDNTVKEIEDIYRTIFVKNQNTSKGVKQAKSDFSDSDTKKQIIDFIEGSDKGVMRGA